MANPAVSQQLDTKTLHAAIVARLPHRSQSSGELRLPAIPALLSHYHRMLLDLFAGLGFRFTDEEQAELEAKLRIELELGFQASPYSKIEIKYNSATPPDSGMHYEIAHVISSVADEYEEWTRIREPPLFGAHPDAKVMSVAGALGEKSAVAILDVGAGTGRNTLPLAREGYRVDAVELAPSLAAVLREELAKTGLSAQVFEGDALDPRLGVPRGAYQLVVLAEVVAAHFRDAAQLRQLFERAAQWLAPGGLFLFSAFLARDGYAPDGLVRQASQAFWSVLFTRGELADAMRGLPFELVSDENCYSFERKHLPKEAWPPTGWFERWARGYDVFELTSGRPPHELRWLTYRRTDGVSEHAAAPAASAVAHIAAPRERVFEAVTDAAQAARWFKPLLPLAGLARRDAFAAEGGKPQPGARRRAVWTDGSVTEEELVAFEAPVRFAYRWTNSLKGPLALLFRSAQSDWLFAPTVHGTSVYWTYRLEPRYRPLARILNIAQGAFERWMRASLTTLQKGLE